MEKTDDFEWVSVSTYARLCGCSTQTVYNKIENNMVEAKRYERGQMRGWLVRRPLVSETENEDAL